MPTANKFMALGREFGLPFCQVVDVSDWIRFTTLSGYTESSSGSATQQSIDDSLILAHKLLYNLYSVSGTAEYTLTDTNTNPNPNTGTVNVSDVSINKEPSTAICSFNGRTEVNSDGPSSNYRTSITGGTTSIVQMHYNGDLIGFGGNLGTVSARLPYARCNVSLSYGQPNEYDNTNPQIQYESENVSLNGMWFTSQAFGRSLYGSLGTPIDEYTITLDPSLRKAEVEASRTLNNAAITAEVSCELTGSTAFYTY